MKLSLLQHLTLIQVIYYIVADSNIHSLATSDFELVDVSEHLSELIRRPGLSTWRVTTDRDINMDYATFVEYQAFLKDDHKNKNKVLPTLWPPSNVRELSLERWFVLPLI